MYSRNNRTSYLAVIVLYIGIIIRRFPRRLTNNVIMLLPALLSRQYLKSIVTYYYSRLDTSSEYNKPGFLFFSTCKRL